VLWNKVVEVSMDSKRKIERLKKGQKNKGKLKIFY